MTRLFAQLRRATWLVIVGTVVAYGCSQLFVNVVLFQGKASQALGSLYAATRFLIQGSLVAGLFSLAVVAVVMFGLGRMHPTDIGWNKSKLRWGLLVTLCFWLAMQGATAFIAGIAPHDAWMTGGASAVMGGFVGQLLGNALVEETVFRGFLLPQFYLKATRKWRPAVALTAATVGSSVLFAVVHVPNRVFVRNLSGMELFSDQAGVFLMGLIFALVYLATRNLFIAVGQHALLNEPMPLLRAPSVNTPYAVWFVLSLVLVSCAILWSATRRDDSGESTGSSS